MNILDLITEIFTNKNYENKFSLPDGTIKFIFNSIQFIFPLILIVCVVVILISFWKLLTAKTYEKNTWPTLLLVTSITFLAFCLSVTLNDLDFTIFKTIVPTVAGITALALFLQNDQKNRMELNDRHKEYRKSILIDRKNRHADAIKTINSGEETNIQTGLRQLRSLLMEWFQDNPSNNYEKYEKRNEIINITDEVSVVFQQNTNAESNKSSSVEETILSIANTVRGGYIPATAEPGISSSFNFQIRRWTQLLIILLRTASHKELSCKPIQERTTKINPKTIDYLHRTIDERLIAQDSFNNRELSDKKNPSIFDKTISIPTKFPISQPSVFCHIGNSFDENNLPSFNFRNAKIDFPIEFSGFQEVDFTESDFYFTFTIKPDYQNTPNAYLIDTQFQDSTFHGSTSFILTKFLFTSSKTPFSNVTFMDSATFKSCVFLSRLLFPHELAIKECDFQDRSYSLVIEDSLFYVPLSLKSSSIPKVKLFKNYFAFETTVTKVATDQITFESCNLESLSVNQIIRILGNTPEIKIKDSKVRKKTVIRGDHSGSTLDINVEKSKFKKKSDFGYTRNYPANKVNVYSSSFSELKISADLEAVIQNISTKRLHISVGNNSKLDISIQDVRGAKYKNTRIKKVSEIVIDSSYGQIGSLFLNNLYVKKIRFFKVDFSHIANIELKGVKYNEIHFEDCTFDTPTQGEEIKRLARSAYKRNRPNTYKDIIESYEYFSNLEDLGL